MAAKSWQHTAMSSHMGEKERRHVELINRGKREGRKKGNNVREEPPR